MTFLKKYISYHFISILTNTNFLLGFVIFVYHLGSDLDCYTKTEGFETSEYEELIEIRSFLSIHSKGYSYIPIVQRSNKKFRHHHRDCMGWSCL